MNILAVVGSYRKGKTIDTLIDKAIEGAKEGGGDHVHVEKLYLIDKNIEYCKNCMVCRRDDPDKPIAKCIIADDMQTIYPMIEKADGFIFGTPVNMGAATAIMKTFLERTCWVLAKPGKRPIRGCPTPRTTRKKMAIIIVSSGIISPVFRRWCDDATPLIKSFCACHLNAKVLGSLYAGGVERKGMDIYLDEAYKLGKKLVSCVQ
ncbi:MAG: flavodoxin family protein [Phycisphaerales bacterium]|nr:MAG: flavodoxin family protein [Phycisphaerales bacterium]